MTTPNKKKSETAPAASSTSHKETTMETKSEPQPKKESRQIRKVGITDTTLRDAHQSLMATRMKVEDMAEIIERMADIGFHSMEVWGGATYDSCMRFLDEDPWERLRTMRRLFKKTKLQMLLRGQNVVGYRHYADDTVREFVKRAVGNGLDIIRVFWHYEHGGRGRPDQKRAHLQRLLVTLSPVHSWTPSASS